MKKVFLLPCPVASTWFTAIWFIVVNVSLTSSSLIRSPVSYKEWRKFSTGCLLNQVVWNLPRMRLVKLLGAHWCPGSLLFAFHYQSADENIHAQTISSILSSILSTPYEVSKEIMRESKHNTVHLAHSKSVPMRSFSSKGISSFFLPLSGRRIASVRRSKCASRSLMASTFSFAF